MREPAEPDGAGEIERETAYWIAVSRVPHIGPARIDRLCRQFGSLRAAWSAPPHEVRAILDGRPLAELLEARGRIEPERELERLAAKGIRALFPGHPDYPRLLAETSGRPSVLYLRGQLTAADERAVAIVGTRRATPYGRQVTERIAAELAQAGVTVISGLARGVDGVAHHAALEAGGRTLAVLGSGVDVIYPSEHRQLAERIVEQGAILSEQPPGAKPDAQNFPARNRIVSGMSLGVVVIEAPLRSGALITATFAADQGRDVFAVPGAVFAPSSEGTNQLLRDGARLVRDGRDVLDDLGLGTMEPVPVQRQLLLNEMEQRLFQAVKREPRHIDEIAEETGLPVAVVSGQMMALELMGLVRNQGAQFYVLR
ncbi:MAG: DNA-processing protein DprA [Thermomicrobiales bacterium]